MTFLSKSKHIYKWKIGRTFVVVCGGLRPQIYGWPYICGRKDFSTCSQLERGREMTWRSSAIVIRGEQVVIRGEQVVIRGGQLVIRGGQVVKIR